MLVRKTNSTAFARISILASQAAASTNAATKWKDPHSISDMLDSQTSQAIISRLESRGKDPVFQSLFDTYFPYVRQNCAKVLEIGAGTGIVCRALASSGFSGLVLGTDQSQVFIDAARKFAAEEALSLDRVQFAVADARKLQSDIKTDDFDCLLMHTLISHVDDPLFVLRSARKLVKKGASLVIVDGDYTGLSYHSYSDPDLSQSMSRALVTATFASPGIVRELPKLLSESGWELESTSGKCVSEIGKQFSYWRTFAEAYMPRVIGSGLMDDAKVNAWWADQQNMARTGQFFAACTYYTIIAKAT